MTSQVDQSAELQRHQHMLTIQASELNKWQLAGLKQKIAWLQKPRPSVTDVIDVLRKYNMLVVHFTYVGKGTDKHLYPDDLQHAIAQPRAYLCASTIAPNDTPLLHSVGYVGVILEPLDDYSVSKLTNGDGGTSDAKHEYPPIDEFERSIGDRGQAEPYNQWTFESSKVRGLFVWGTWAVDRRILFPSPLPHEAGEMIETVDTAPVSLAELLESFPGQRIFSTNGTDFVEIHRNGSQTVVPHSAIYP